ncbi:cytochrome c maturation protein CcmE, partial [Rhizobium ruizarguesonis]
LFREGQGLVTEGMFATGTNVFIADTVLSKHDETYMSKDVSDRLKAQGLWKEGQEAKATP